MHGGNGGYWTTCFLPFDKIKIKFWSTASSAMVFGRDAAWKVDFLSEHQLFTCLLLLWNQQNTLKRFQRRKRLPSYKQTRTFKLFLHKKFKLPWLREGGGGLRAVPASSTDGMTITSSQQWSSVTLSLTVKDIRITSGTPPFCVR